MGGGATGMGGGAAGLGSATAAFSGSRRASGGSRMLAMVARALSVGSLRVTIQPPDRARLRNQYPLPLRALPLLPNKAGLCQSVAFLRPARRTPAVIGYSRAVSVRAVRPAGTGSPRRRT